MFNKYTFLLLFFALCLSACVDENIGLDGAVVQLNALVSQQVLLIP